MSIQHNFVTTLSQGYNKVVTVSITKLFQACHKAALWQPCGNLVTTLSFLYGLRKVPLHFSMLAVWIIDFCTQRNAGRNLWNFS